MDARSLDGIIDRFFGDEASEVASPKKKPATFWLPNEYKEAYDQLQEAHDRKFSQVVCQVIMAAIDRARARSLGLHSPAEDVA